MNYKKLVVGETITFEGEELRLLGLKPSPKPIATATGEIVGVDRHNSVITVRWPEKR